MVNTKQVAIDPALVRHVFEKSFASFLEKEGQGLLGDVNERNSCGRLAMHMENIARAYGLDAYYADPEYNRNQGQVKTILDGDHKVISINCDLILHSRGQIKDADNLIAVEMKKSNRPDQEKQSDRDRLRALTKASYDGVWLANGIDLPKHVCGYLLGAYIEINRAKMICLVEYYSLGVMFEAHEIPF